jgi:PKD repeat protein
MFKRLFFRIAMAMVLLSTLFITTPVPVAAATLTLSPSLGISNTANTITITGSGYAINTTGNIWFDTDGDNVMDAGEPQISVTTTVVGAIPTGKSLTTPLLIPGAYNVTADIPSGGSIEKSAIYTLAPALTLSPSSGLMNTVIPITVTGSGYANSTAGNVWLDLDGDSVMDAGEPQAAVTTTATGVISGSIILTTPLLPPGKSYYMRADIPAGGSIEKSSSFSTSTTTTSIVVTKYDPYGNVIATVTKDYQWLETNLPVQGDGVTRYYGEGPYFTTDYDTFWDTSETGLNIDSRDFGQPKGTDTKDLCELVGGMSPGDIVNLNAPDNFNKVLDYENIYNPVPEQGKVVVCWYNAAFGGYVPTYGTGMRLIFFPETTNPDGKYVFGDWDMHQTLPASRWYFYSGTNPSSGGISVQTVYNIDIYQPKLVSCDAAGVYKDTFAPGETVYVKGAGLAASINYKLWLQGEPVLFMPLGFNEVPSGTWSLNAANDPSGSQETVGTNGSGDFAPTAIWNISTSASIPATFDIVADNQSSGTVGTYDAADAIDNPGYEGFRVLAQAPVAAFTSDVQTGTAPLTVQFTDQSTGTAPLTYAWDFDNNGTTDSTNQNPSHVYSSAAETYTVKLTVTNAGGSDDEVKTNYISVTAPPVPFWDLNADHICNIGDVVIIGLKWGQTGALGWCPEDLSPDGVINIGDVVVLGLHWGQSW